jgi:hypothetical protein
MLLLPVRSDPQDAGKATDHILHAVITVNVLFWCVADVVLTQFCDVEGVDQPAMYKQEVSGCEEGAKIPSRTGNMSDVDNPKEHELS